MSERDQLAADILASLAGPKTPEAPRNPGPDASPAERETFDVATKDHTALLALSKSTGNVSKEERDELHRQTLDFLRKGW